MTDASETNQGSGDAAKVETAKPAETPWIALQPLRWGMNDDGTQKWLNPGDPVPAGEGGRNYEMMRRTGQIAYKDAVQTIPAAAPVPFRLHDEYLPREPGAAQAPVGGEGAGEPSSAGEGGTGTGGEGGGSDPNAGPEPAPIPLSEAMTLAELGAIAESMGLPSSGSKAQIIARIEKARAGNGEGGGA